MDLIADMMEKDPKSRLSSAADVVQRLEPWASSATPLPHPTLTKSPWLPPPLPSGREETVDDLSELAREVIEQEDRDQASSEGSQVSQSTDAVAGHDTVSPLERLVVPVPPPAPTTPPSSTAAVLRALAIAIPLSMLAGGLLTFLYLELLR